MKPLSLRKVSRDELAYVNLIAHHGRPLKFEWLDSEWTFEWQPRLPRRDGLSEIAIDWGGSRGVLRVDPATVDAVALRVLGAPVAASAPAALVAALVETALGDLLALVESATRRRVRVLADDTPATGEDTCCIGWRLAADDQGSTGELWIDALGLGFIATACKGLSAHGEAARSDAALPPDLLASVPIPITLSAGWTDLSVAQLSTLRMHDVVLIEECWLGGDTEITVRVGHALGLRGTLSGNHLHITEGFRPIMSDSNLPLHAHDLDAEPLDEIPVRLTFDLGQREMTLAELRAIVPGQTFDLGRDVRSAVTVRANGRPVAQGELVDINGRVGVSLLAIGRVAS